jgi:poly(A) polymerase
MGLDDLHKKIVRTIGDPYKRFSEDPVRILRALKLVGQYEFSLESETEKALISLQEKIILSSVSRLSLELEKILKKPFSYKILKTFFDYGFLSYYIPPLHRHFGKDEGQIAMKLLNIECNKLRRKNSYEYISLPMALLAAPAVSYHYTGMPDNFTYKYEHEDKKNIRKIVRSLFLPLVFPKFIIHEAADAIFMQSRIFNDEIRNWAKKQKHHRRNMYIACKLALIINEYSFNDEQIFDFCNEILKDYIRN